MTINILYVSDIYRYITIIKRQFKKPLCELKGNKIINNWLSTKCSVIYLAASLIKFLWIRPLDKYYKLCYKSNDINSWKMSSNIK